MIEKRLQTASFQSPKPASPSAFCLAKYISTVEAYAVGENSGFTNALVLQWWHVGWGGVFSQSEHFLLKILE